jgi:hypothetical protein
MIFWKTTSLLMLASHVGCSVDEGPYFIPGSATLPNCTEPPDFDLTGGWSDNPGSIVSIRTAGCDDAPADSEFESCSEDAGMCTYEEDSAAERFAGLARRPMM